MKKILSSISYKLTVPVVLLVLLIVIVNLISKWQALQEVHYESAITRANNITILIESKKNAASHKALLAASIFSDLSSVKWAYTVYDQIDEIDSASAMVERKIKPMLRTVKNVTGINTKIHFHLPPARSFYRSWTSKKGDDLSTYRNSLLEISGNHNPIRGIEVDRNGFFVRGISPIYNSSREYLGSVEVFFPFVNVVNKVINKEDEDYAVYIRKDKLSIATKLGQSISNHNKNNDRTGAYSLIKNSDSFQNEFLFRDDFNKADKEIQYKTIENYVYALVPINDYRGENIGLLSLQVDITESVEEIQSTLIRYVIMGFVLLIIVSIILVFLINIVVSKPIKKLSYNISEIAEGKLIDEIETKSADEVGHIYRAVNTLLDRLKTSTHFANEIGKGNLEVNIDNVSDEDTLSQSLISMKDNLLEARETEAMRKSEEEKRNWSSTGIAKFADILRQNTENMKQLSEVIIRNLVDYIGANQGGLFILNDNDESDLSLELLSAVAFERKKFLEKTIKLGEGLVGACAVEKETIYMTEVPKEYINITSGLGESNPRCVLVVPLKIEDEVYGVIEMASFKNIEDYQIEFIETVSESIASTLSSVKVNQRTAELLEQSQQQSEELAAQEEEMRQNLEEMQATQESLTETTESAEKSVFTINNIDSPIINIDKDFNVTFINKAGMEFSNLSEDAALTKKCYEVFTNPHCQTKECRLAKAMKTNKSESGKTIINETPIFYTGTPLHDENGDIIGALEQIIDLSVIDKTQQG